MVLGWTWTDAALPAHVRGHPCGSVQVVAGEDADPADRLRQQIRLGHGLQSFLPASPRSSIPVADATRWLRRGLRRYVGALRKLEGCVQVSVLLRRMPSAGRETGAQWLRRAADDRARHARLLADIDAEFSARLPMPTPDWPPLLRGHRLRRRGSGAVLDLQIDRRALAIFKEGLTRRIPDCDGIVGPLPLLSFSDFGGVSDATDDPA